MAQPATTRRRRAIVALLAAVAVLLPAGVATAAPADPEGGTRKLRDTLAAATRGHIEAKNRLDNSRRRQLRHQVRLAGAQRAAAGMQSRVVALAVQSYRTGRLSGLTMLLNSSSPDAFLQRAVRLDMMARVDARTLTDYRTAADAALAEQRAVDREVAQQRVQVEVMARRKAQAERALATVGGGASRGFVGVGAPPAQPAARGVDGSWPGERCSVPDPTSSGCITPRLLHAYQQARAAGFRRYTSCFSRRSSGEHPLGRACDFAASAGGFANADASGGDRAYGDSLAAYLVRNADRLGVMYVIWYRQFWSPASGWRAYSGHGPPNVTHTNHVHLSVL